MPQARECVEAHDLTYKGRVDLSRAVTVGEPVKKSPLRWAVPYNVKDAAGNAADTVWRDVVVEEVDLNDVESSIRNEVLQQQKAETQKAVQRALEEDRKKRPASSRRQSPTPASCPECPVCDCSGEVDVTKCEAICAAQTQFCPVSDDSWVIRAMLWLENVLPPSMVPSILLCMMLLSGFFVLRWMLSLMFSPAAYRPGYHDIQERERRLMESVNYYETDHRGSASATALPPPRASLSTVGNGFLSPTTTATTWSTPRGTPSSASRNGSGHRLSSAGGDINDIYRTQIITPRKRGGDGVLNRSPYGPGSR